MDLSPLDHLYFVTYRNIFYLFSGVGITGGVHRLWAHRSYKATFPLRVYLMLSNSIANQGDFVMMLFSHKHFLLPRVS